MLHKTLLALLLGLTVLLAACDVIDLDPDPSISISPSMSGSIEPGSSGQLLVSISRTEFTEAVTVGLENPPAGITATSQSTTENSVTLSVSVAASVAKGSHSVTVAASGSGVDKAQATVSITVGTGPIISKGANKIEGTISNWNQDNVVLRALSNDSNSGEQLGNDDIGKNGVVNIELIAPTLLTDLVTSLNREWCFSGSSNLVSSPASLPGAFVMFLANDFFDILVREQSFPAGEDPLTGQFFVLRVYSANSGKVTGSCQSSDGGRNVTLQFDVTLGEGWNYVVATYNDSNQSYNLKEASALPAGAELRAFIFTSATNEAPIADLTTDVEGGFNEVSADASGSFDIDGFIVDYFFDMGDGNSFSDSDGIIESYVYAASGDYTVTVTVFDDDGASATATAIASAF
jgi:PKD repeat protein